MLQKKGKLNFRYTFTYYENLFSGLGPLRALLRGVPIPRFTRISCRSSEWWMMPSSTFNGRGLPIEQCYCGI